MLSSFLKASLQSASSLIILNGLTTSALRLTKSIRQGCPLSPLLFILAFDTLSHMLNRAVICRSIVGVEFRDIGLATLHTMFADNLSLIVRASMIYILHCQQILQLFSNISGLRCLWEQTAAAFIPKGPPLAEFWLLPWTWEENSNASPLLGFPVAAEFSIELMESHIVDKLEARIDKIKNQHLSLAARVTVANGLILSMLWYMLTLWADSITFLSKTQKRIKSFVWAGRPRVDRSTITQSRAKGGLGLLLIVEQYHALAGNLMVWTLGPRDHPLRQILCSHL